ncbi:MAG: VOC family protein [Pseudomonadota bacterium]
MIAYTMVGTRNLDNSVAFYAPIMEILGLEPCWRDEQLASWGKKDNPDVTRFFTCLPFNEHDAVPGNGVMVAFRIEDNTAIDRLYNMALKNGATDAGKPGPRPHYSPGFYGAMF